MRHTDCQDVTRREKPSLSGVTISDSRTTLTVYHINRTKCLIDWSNLKRGHHEVRRGHVLRRELPRLRGHVEPLGRRQVQAVGHPAQCVDLTCISIFMHSIRRFLFDLTIVLEQRVLSARLRHRRERGERERGDVEQPAVGTIRRVSPPLKPPQRFLGEIRLAEKARVGQTGRGAVLDAAAHENRAGVVRDAGGTVHEQRVDD